jgi:cell division protein FtsB
MNRYFGALISLLFLSGFPAWAEPAQNEVAKLKARVEKLEAENAAIKKELADLKAQVTTLRKSPSKSPNLTEAKQLEQAIEAFRGDLIKDRLTSAYNFLSARRQKRMDRKAFNAFIKKHPLLKARLFLTEYKFRKLPKEVAANGYECYVLCSGGTADPVLNMTLRLVQEGGDWKLDEFVEIKEKKRPD